MVGRLEDGRVVWVSPTGTKVLNGDVWEVPKGLTCGDIDDAFALKKAEVESLVSRGILPQEELKLSVLA